MVEAVQGGVVGLAADRLRLHEPADLLGAGGAPLQQMRHDGEAFLACRGARHEPLQGLFPGMLHGVLPAALSRASSTPTRVIAGGLSFPSGESQLPGNLPVPYRRVIGRSSRSRSSTRFRYRPW